MVHAEHGPHLVSVWYRPLNLGEIQTIASFRTELESLANTSVGSIILGDLNVHNKLWLNHSSHDSPESQAMKDACDDLRLEQKVRQPTREAHLLDLVMSDIPGVVAKVLPTITDHNVVKAELAFKVPEQVTVSRAVRLCHKADWERMRQQLEDMDWTFLATCDPHTGAQRINEATIDAAKQCIPTTVLRERKSIYAPMIDRGDRRIGAGQAGSARHSERACSGGEV